MSRLIDADALKKKAYTSYECTSQPDRVVSVDDIDDAPTVDAVPVVRCEACRHWGSGKDGGFGDYRKCALDGAWHKSDFYCKSGERKE